jgi:hypothetical protein
MAYTDKKILVAEHKRDDGLTLITRLDEDNWETLRGEIEANLDYQKSTSVRFFYRGKKWVVALPEAD